MSTLSIESISAQSQQVVKDKVSMSVAKKSLDIAKTQGNAAVSLIQSAGSNHSGSSGHSGGPSHAGGLDVMG